MDLVAGRTVTAERRPIRHLDPLLLGSALILAIVGLFMIFSATKPSLQTLRLDQTTFVKKQVTFVALGLIVTLVMATFNYRFLKIYAGFIYAALVVGLVLVRTPLGTSVAGAQRGFYIGGFQITPSEYMKIGMIVMLAAFLAELKTQDLSLQDVFRATAIVLFPAILVFFQPDVGTTIVMAAILVGVLVVAGASARHLGALALTAAVLLFGAFQLHVVKDYQLERLSGFLDPQSDPLRTGYNRTQAEIAIGSGGLTGTGYGRGTQTNLDFVPQQHTDFIFTVVGEEFGFVGSMVLLTLFAILIWRAFRIALLSKDAFGTFVAAGIASMWSIQVFVNVGMTLGIMPITGIPLPFVSYGGSSLLANCAAVGLLLNVHMRRLK